MPVGFTVKLMFTLKSDMVFVTVVKLKQKGAKFCSVLPVCIYIVHSGTTLCGKDNDNSLWQENGFLFAVGLFHLSLAYITRSGSSVVYSTSDDILCKFKPSRLFILDASDVASTATQLQVGNLNNSRNNQ